MAWFGGAKELSVEELIARKKYAKAIELLREQFKAGSRDVRMRQKLADVLIIAGKGREAAPILVGLADEHAREGFAAKAIALLKKIEKIDPGRKDVEQKLATLIHQEKGRNATGSTAVRLPAAEPLPELGVEEIGFEPSPPPNAPRAAETDPLPLGADADASMSEQDFALELVEVAHEAIEAQAQAPAAPPRPAVASPLFSDFEESELVAVMHGMELLSFEPGDVIITEGEPGDSLFVLTTGVVKAFIRNPTGRHVLVREMGEGSFFGEISILSGRPRTATVTAAARCELLELDKATLDAICNSHPGVLNVLKAFYTQRQGSKSEKMIRGMSFGEPQR